MKKIIFLLMCLLCISLVSAEVQITNIDYKWSKFGKWSKVTFRMINTGSTDEYGVIGLEHEDRTPFSVGYIGSQSMCNPNNPDDVHRDYYLNPGDSVDVELIASNFKDGTYYPKIVHVTRCCSHPDGCQAKEPYGWAEWLNNENKIEFGDEEANVNDECDNPSTALDWLQSHGDGDCILAECKNALSDDSNARCLERGCYSGNNQFQNCDDGTSIVIRTCVNKVWQVTGKECPDKPIIPPPKPPIDIPLEWVGIGLLVIIGLGVMIWMLNKK